MKKLYSVKVIMKHRIRMLMHHPVMLIYWNFQDMQEKKERNWQIYLKMRLISFWFEVKE